MDQDLENAFLTGLEQNKQRLLRICSVYSNDEEDRKDLFQEVLVNMEVDAVVQIQLVDWNLDV